ncbi:MAG: hypothetical protein ACFCVK_15835 [Acidimicrobiales bacterium]
MRLTSAVSLAAVVGHHVEVSATNTELNTRPTPPDLLDRVVAIDHRRIAGDPEAGQGHRGSCTGRCERNRPDEVLGVVVAREQGGRVADHRRCIDVRWSSVVAAAERVGQSIAGFVES